MIAATGSAFAFDITQTVGSARAAVVDVGAQQAFRDGLAAYYGGRRAEALRLFIVAADGGLPEAQWKVGRMYAEGDGAKVDEAKAFDYFGRLVRAHGDEDRMSPLAPYVANALTELGHYCLRGVPALKLKPDPDRAMRLLYLAANNFGDPEAQYRLGLMYRDGEGVPQDERRAAQWLLSAAKKGQVGAQAALGDMLVDGDNSIQPNPVGGLMWLTIALKRAILGGPDQEAVRKAHERALSEMEEQDRQRALRLADRWLAQHPEEMADAPAAVAAAPVVPADHPIPPASIPVAAGTPSGASTIPVAATALSSAPLSSGGALANGTLPGGAALGLQATSPVSAFDGQPAPGDTPAPLVLPNPVKPAQ